MHAQANVNRPLASDPKARLITALHQCARQVNLSIVCTELAVRDSEPTKRGVPLSGLVSLARAGDAVEGTTRPVIILVVDKLQDDEHLRLIDVEAPLL